MAVSADPNAEYVSVHCDGLDESHPHERWLIATFHPDESGKYGDGVYWSESVQGYQSPSSTTLTRLSGSVTGFLAGDEFVPQADPSEDDVAEMTAKILAGASIAEPPAITRSSYTFQCGRCALRPRARQETLFPIFNILREHGVSVITLRALAARLQ